jgi:lipoprotein-releasing system permease protein
MTYSLKIAWRYFFSKSKQTVINRINTFAFFMVVIATATLFIVLSAFSGLKDFGLSFSNNFDPDFEILPERDLFFSVSDITLNQIEKLPVIYAVAPLIEKKVFLSFKEKSQVAFLKAVSPKYTQVVPLENLIALGDWLSHKGSDVVVGFGIAGSMGLSVYDYNSYLNVIVPKKKKQTLLDQNPFTSSPAIVSGLYQISEDLDKKYVFSSLSFGQDLLELSSNQYSSIVLKTMPGTQKASFEKSIRSFFKIPIRIVSREEQNMALYRMLNIEHLAIYFIFTLVMIIALFNVVGALVMMILDKKSQLNTLLTIGADPRGVHQIFFSLGLLICGFGGVIGLLLGSALVFTQFYFPFIYVPGTSLAYPVLFDFKNILIVLGTLMTLGTISTAWATRGLSEKLRL